VKSAKQIKNETNISKYIKEKLEDIEVIIDIHKDLGYGYAKYSGVIPSVIQDMLVELGYTLLKSEDIFTNKTTIICWANAPDEDLGCN
jgi:hypothetical protein